MESNYIPYHAEHCPPVGRVLVFAPHPDDEVFGCGGAIIRHVAQGDVVSTILVTDGAAATSHQDKAAKQRYIAARYAESVAAAKVLGYQDIQTWGMSDRTLVCDVAPIQRAIDAIRATGATHIYAPSVFEIHPDHVALAEIAIAAVIATQTILVMYEVGVPLHPNRLLDTTAIQHQKTQAMHCFGSQTQLNNYIDVVASLNRFRTYTLPPTVQFAEGFYQVSGTDLRDTPILRYGKTRQTEAMLAQAAVLANPPRAWWQRLLAQKRKSKTVL